MVEQRKQTGTDLAVRGQADARTVSAERVRDGRDDADFALAVVEGITPRSFAGFIRQLAHRTELVQSFQDFIHRNDYIGRPDAVFFERHEFDETDHDAFFPREA